MAEKPPTPDKPKSLSHPLMGASEALVFTLPKLYGAPDKKAWVQYALIFLAMVGRLPFTIIEKAVVATKRKAVKPINPPVFIIGHWRSGTTHLYNVMAKAPRFAYVTPYQTGLPWDFLTLTKLFRPLLRKSLPKGRSIDDVPVTPESPQEDEFALANMMAHSFLHALYFPKDFFETFNKGLFFEGLKEDDIKDWQEKLKYFYLKMQIANPGKTLLIKNPPYTARVGLLKKMFPGAKFIHIHRNPYKVFFSMRNFYDQLLPELSLQDYDVGDLDDHILATFTRMMDDLEKETQDLPEDRFISVPFADLQKDPTKTLKKVYAQLKLGDFKEDEGIYKDYLSDISDYKKNVYDYPEEDLKKVETHWRKFIKAGGYKRP